MVRLALNRYALEHGRASFRFYAKGVPHSDGDASKTISAPRRHDPGGGDRGGVRGNAVDRSIDGRGNFLADTLSGVDVLREWADELRFGELSCWLGSLSRSSHTAAIHRLDAGTDPSPHVLATTAIAPSGVSAGHDGGMHSGLTTVFLGALIVAAIQKSGMTEMIMVLAPVLVGLSISASWMTLLLGRRWRAEASWIDRLGRALGVLWILISILIVGLLALKS